MTLPRNIPYELMLTKWPAQLDPALSLFTQIQSIPFLNGQAITGILLNATTPKSIPHTLGRAPVGWFLTDLLTNTTVWRTQPFTAGSITLESGADTTISFWVF